jgi:ankyrin repeat protein/GTPase SAR1 family protein
MLVKEFGCDPNDGASLYLACEDNNLSMVKTLIDCGADPNARNNKGITPLHIACQLGNLSMVKTLIDSGANLENKDARGYTPLALAVLNDHKGTVSALVKEFGCDPNDGVSLHVACREGNLDIVSILICLGADVGNTGVRGNTPLHEAIRTENVAQTLLKHKSNPNARNNQGITPLHIACGLGNMSMVKTLIDCGANLENKNASGYTPLALAVRNGHKGIVSALVREYGCDIHVLGRRGMSLLHVAATECVTEMLRLLITEYGMSPSLVDEEGNTPLHLACSAGRSINVHTLLYEFQSRVYTRNRKGKTPGDVADGHNIKTMLDQYILEHQGTIEEDYKSMQKLAAAKYSGAHCITRLFVVGHPGAGKSSLVEALKREGFIQSFKRVSSKSVALHTAGIVPTIHTSDSYGRVQFYDFAGDPEYYSSHAAILEKLFLSDVGNNICIIVLNLQDNLAELENRYLYWLTFINHNTKHLQHPPSVIVTGSHADLLSKKDLQIKENYIKGLFEKHQNNQAFLTLDCCGPRSNNVKVLRQQIQELADSCKPYELSYEASVLLGLLEKDFQSVTACTVKTIVTHIAKINLLRLPKITSGLITVLKQLQDIGSLLMLGGKEEDHYLVLNVSQLTNEVHKRLFSKEAFSSKPDMPIFKIGLLPQSKLQEVLPPYITKECLTQLQYCQEISRVEIGQDYFISPSSDPEGIEVSFSPEKSFLFFPALCKLDKNITWYLEESYSIGWLARCTIPHDYFPLRFLHVLLLRVALRFTLAAPTTSPDHVAFKRRCKMWKTGVHWLTEEGVECEVDVNISKEVVVSIRSEEHSKEALTTFNNIISCVMETKAEFCHSIQLQCYLLDKIGCFSEDNLFTIEDVERVLEKGKKKVVSTGGGTWMSTSKLLHIRSTFWDSLFPLDEQSVLQYIEALVEEWFQLGEYLKFPYPTLRAIESDFPQSVRRRKSEMVITWLNSPLPNSPCWWSLVKALQEMGENSSAAAIIRDQGTSNGGT